MDSHFIYKNVYRIPNPGSRVDFYTKELMPRGCFIVENRLFAEKLPGGACLEHEAPQAFKDLKVHTFCHNVLPL